MLRLLLMVSTASWCPVHVCSFCLPVGWTDPRFLEMAVPTQKCHPPFCSKESTCLPTRCWSNRTLITFFVIMSGLDCTKIAWHLLDSRLPQDLDGPTTQYSVGKYLQKRCPVERVWNVWNLRIQKFRSRKDSSWAALKDWAAENTTASGRNFRILRPLKASEKTINQMGLFSGRSVCTSMNLRQTKDGRTPKLILNKSPMIWSISSVNEVFSAVEELLPEPVFQASKMQCKVQ